MENTKAMTNVDLDNPVEDLRTKRVPNSGAAFIDGFLETLYQSPAIDDFPDLLVGESDYWRSRMGRLIRQRRLELKMSQQQLASQFDVSQESIGQYERGKVGLAAADIPRLARCLNVPITYLYGEVEVVGLSDWERSLLEQARSLSAADWKRALQVFQALYDYAEQTGALRQKVPRSDAPAGASDPEAAGER